MGEAIVKWAKDADRQRVAEIVRGFLAKNPGRKLVEVSDALGFKPVKVTFPGSMGESFDVVNSSAAKRIRRLMDEAPSETHASLAHEVFHAKKKYGIRHIKDFFGKKRGQELLDEFIRQNPDMPIKEVAETFGMERDSLYPLVNRSTRVWQEWFERNKSYSVRMKKKSQIRDRVKAEAAGRRKAAQEMRFK
jgi:predicted DNA-binding protein YlxM (UPF0122 family)